MSKLVVVALIPLFAIGNLGGVAFLLHSHDEHGFHLHAAPSKERARDVASRHLAAHVMAAEVGELAHLPCHRHRSPCDHAPPQRDDGDNAPAPFDDPGGVLIVVPDHEPLLKRGVDSGLAFAHPQLLRPAALTLWIPPDIIEDRGSPGGPPRHLSALSTGQRIVRTSCALLI